MRPPLVRSGDGRRRPPVLFVSWGAVAGRSAEIAGALGGASLAVFPPAEGRRPPVLVRYLLGAVLTACELVRLDPRSVVATNPPALPGLIALAWSRLRGVPFALDSHPGSFGRQGDRASGHLMPVHRFLARRAAVSLVTTDEWVRVVRGWGGEATVLHEAPGDWQLAAPPPERPARRPLVCVVSRFAGDEPVGAAVAAARRMPAADFMVTGRLADLTGELAAAAPGNVTFVGFLEPPAYRTLLSRADVVATLTSEPTSVMRAAYEAVYAGKPLVVSDWPVARELFPHAVHVRNTPSSIAAGVAEALARRSELSASAAADRTAQVARFERQLGVLRRALQVERGAAG
jgi:glycosyltransferase involved in cell wall biosynthesis